MMVKEKKTISGYGSGEASEKGCENINASEKSAGLKKISDMGGGNKKQSMGCKQRTRNRGNNTYFIRLNT